MMLNNPEDILEEIRKLDPKLAEMLEAGAGAEITLPYLEVNHPIDEKELADAEKES